MTDPRQAVADSGQAAETLKTRNRALRPERHQRPDQDPSSECPRDPDRRLPMRSAGRIERVLPTHHYPGGSKPNDRRKPLTAVVVCLSDDQRARVKAAADDDQLDADGTRLLLDTGCPIGPVGTKWEAEPEYSWSWPESVRTFVTAQDSGV